MTQSPSRPVGPALNRRAELLAAYDRQLRAEAEMDQAEAATRIGPTWCGVFESASGLVSYRDLAGWRGARLDDLVGECLRHFRARGVAEVEWKTRGHDGVPELHQILLDHGFVPEEEESVMIGPAGDVAIDVPLPGGVSLRRVTDADGVRAMVAMQEEVFGRRAPGMVDSLVAHLPDAHMELWIAEVDGQVIGTGRLNAVPGTQFAGIWGGATLEAWRGKGIYRAITAVRARSALRMDKPWLHSDSTDFSRPILERNDFVRVTTTRPYLWRDPSS